MRIFLGIDKVDIVVPLDNKEKYRQVSEANDTVKQYALLYRGTAGLFFVLGRQGKRWHPDYLLYSGTSLQDPSDHVG